MRTSNLKQIYVDIFYDVIVLHSFFTGQMPVNNKTKHIILLHLFPEPYFTTFHPSIAFSFSFHDLVSTGPNFSLCSIAVKVCYAEGTQEAVGRQSQAYALVWGAPTQYPI
jgi:hypothetical protein